MGLFTTSCPQCGKSVPNKAAHCNNCGCPAATAWTDCPKCGSAIGADSKFCWKCGTQQDPAARRAFYGDRWQRTPGEFAARVDLNTPDKALRHALRIDEGTLALLFEDGRMVGTLEAGLHPLDNVLQRLLGLDKGRKAHAVLIDMLGAEVDFAVEDLRAAEGIPFDARVRLLLQVTDPKTFALRVVGDAPTFETRQLTERFHGDVQAALQSGLAGLPLDTFVLDARPRELAETALLTQINPVLAAHGLTCVGVRLALNRQLADASRRDKVGACREEAILQDEFAKVAHEFGLEGERREQERKRFLQAADHTLSLDGLQQDYVLRRTEISNRLDEQKLRHESEMLDIRHELAGARLRFEEELRQQHERFRAGLEQQVAQAETDLEVARRGVDALKLVKDAKFAARAQEEELATKVEADRLAVRGQASIAALLATVGGEHGDRLLKLAELEMRKGLSAEQALALVAEKSPEIAPAVAEILRARSAQAGASGI
ncbi:MAG: Double zinc ribbon [Verrucomicrobia bacterium ADurb.Bin122]|nr:MAG: Double zinc ribbon [Verrucomicrobia bacterium ADurb.Bin122]